MKKALLIAVFFSLTSVASAHLEGWKPTLRVDADAPGVFSSGANKAVVSPLRDIKFVATLSGDVAANVPYTFSCDKESNIPTKGVANITADQTINIDLSCKFPGEGDYAPNIIFQTPSGEVSATLNSLATFNSKIQPVNTSEKSDKSSWPKREFVIGIILAILAALIYKFLPSKGGSDPNVPVGWNN